MLFAVRPLRCLLPRCASALAVVAACAASVGAQAPARPTDPAPRVVDASEGASQLAANAVRAAAASAPRPPVVRSTRPLAAWSVSASSFRDSVLVSIARTAVGARYVRGGQSVDRGFDCSGLVRYIMAALRVPVPRTAVEQAYVGISLGRDTTRLRPGDLLTFGRGPREVSHVGIYLGNGRYVHASSVAGEVIESDIGRPPAARVREWRGSRRVLSDARPDSVGKGDG